MKITTLVRLLLAWLISHASLGQIAFQDAAILRKFVNTQGEFATIPNAPNDYIDVLAIYAPDSLQKKPKEQIKGYYLAHNPFIRAFISPASGLNASLPQAVAERRSLTSRLGGLNVTTFADGMAKFLVERSKEELSVAFFDKFKRDLGNYPELTNLFPTTTDFLSVIAAYQYAAMLTVLREAFNKDLSQLDTRLERLRALSVADCHTASGERGKRNCEKRMQRLTDFFHTPESIYFVAATSLIRAMRQGSNPADIIQGLAADSAVSRFPTSNLANAVKVMHLFSQSLRSADGDRTWISREEVDSLVRQPTFMNLYLGLLYQMSVKQGIRFNTVTFADVLSRLTTGTNTSYLTNIISQGSTFDALFRSNQSERTPNAPLAAEAYFEYADAYASLLESFLDFPRSFALDSLDSARPPLITLTRSSVNLYFTIKSRNYGSAVFHTIAILNQTFGGDFRYKEQVFQYGSFMATVTQAKNSDEVKRAIEAVALPVGSARVKRESRYNVALNAYLGGFYGREYLEAPGQGWRNTYGVFAPVGLSFSAGLGKHHNDKVQSRGALSLFVSLLDVGAVASFRSRDNSTERLPKFTLQNILAPGVYLVYGIPKTPLSVGGGVQRGPQLREVTLNNATIEASAYRWQLWLAVDIPLLNFATRPW